MTRRWSVRLTGAFLAAAAVVAVAPAANAATPTGVTPMYARDFGLTADPAGYGKTTVHGWGTLNWGTTYFYATNVSVKDDAADSHSVKMIIKVPGLGSKTCSNSGGNGTIKRCGKWTFGHVSDMTGGPTAQLCVWNSTSNICTKPKDI